MTYISVLDIWDLLSTICLTSYFYITFFCDGITLENSAYLMKIVGQYLMWILKMYYFYNLSMLVKKSVQTKYKH